MKDINSHGNNKNIMDLMSSDSPVELVKWLRTQKEIPSLAYLYGVKERLDYHPEGDSGIHLEMAVVQAWRHCESVEERAAVVLHDIGKAVTGRAIPNPTDVELGPVKLDESGVPLPTHHGHDRIGSLMMRDVFDAMRLPRDWLALAETVADYHQRLHAVEKSTANSVVMFIEQIEERNPTKTRSEAVEAFVRCVRSDFNGRLGFENLNYTQGDFLIKAEKAMSDYESSQDLIEAANKEIEDAKQSIFTRLSQELQGISEHLVWKDTMIELRRLQSVGEIPPKQDSMHTFVSKAISEQETKAQPSRRVRP